MANPTTNFGWQMPTSTDLVTSLPADFETFGQAVDTSLAELKGGTTGQVLSKASNTDMDFVWVTDAAGDITGVTAGTGISGGGTSGTVTITNSMATAITTNGDLLYGTGSGTFSRLGIGSTDQVLKVTGGVPAWGTVTTTAPGLSFISATSFTSATSVSINSCFTSTYDNYLVTINQSSGTGGYYTVKMRLSGTDSSVSYTYNTLTTNGATVSSATSSAVTTGFATDANDQSRPAQASFELQSPAQAVYTWYRSSNFSSNMGGTGVKHTNGVHSVATAYDGMTISWTNSATGTVRIYGLRNS